MEFINKTNHAIFHPNYITFENNKWNTSTNNYGLYNYDGFSTAFKNTIKGLLIAEQENLCCYCMKQLEQDGNSSIEHLYPNNPHAGNIFANYSITCIEKNLFDFSTRQIPVANLENLPHDISYYNLLACCVKCNNTRDAKEIRPFVFDGNIKTEFSYDANGNIYSLKYQDEITKIDLANIYYVNYRHLWKHIGSTCNATIFSNENSLKRAVTKAALELYIKTKSVFYVDFMLNGIKVKEAIAYRYFFV